jgi:anti-sigma regulatory factor (Ser/Thr protein kinase)
MPRCKLAPTTQWITAAAVQHGNELATHVAGRLDISRRRAQALLRRLEATQWLRKSGTSRHAQFEPGALRQVVQRYALAGLLEDLPWRRDFAPYFQLGAEVRRIVQHAFTELLNNAIDHSGGTSVTVSMRQTPAHLQLLVSDDGCGLFARIAEHFDIEDPNLAIFELAKGKLTTQPQRHSGHGLYFTAQLADVFDLRANASGFQSRAWSPARWHASEPQAALAGRLGTSAFFALALDTPRTLDGVLRAASVDGEGYGFERTRASLHLIGGREATLASRADAKRVAARLDRFAHVEIDFTGVEGIGHGFADELMRVLPAERPTLNLLPTATNPRVASMLRAAIAGA